MPASDGLDNILSQLGTGRWNYLHFASSTMVPAVLPIFMIGGEFLNPVPLFSCKISDNFTRAINDSQCLMMEESDGKENIVPCKQWTYDTSVFHSTVSMEWDLVCDKAWLSPFFQTIYTIGCFIGAILAGISADRFGRRWAMRTGALMTIGAMLMLIFAPWLPAILSARFLLGVFNTIMVCPAFMISMEICKPSLRPTVGILLALPYALMMMGLAGMAYLFRDWRTLQAAGSFPCIILLPLVYLIDESPRWLVVRGRLEEAVEVLQRALRLNRPSLQKDLDFWTVVSLMHQKQTGMVAIKSTQNSKVGQIVPTEISNSSASATRPIRSSTQGDILGPDEGFGSWWAGPMALIRTHIMRKLTLVLVLVWLLQGIVYLGLPLSSSSFSSPFLYITLMGLVELPAYSLTAPITKKLGRKTVITTCLISCGICLFSIVVLKKIGFNEEWLHLSIVLISYLLVCTAYQVNFLYAPELLPTTLRPWGTAACTLSAYIGFSIPPFIADSLGENLQWISAAIFGACGLVAGLLVFLLPETNGRDLPETVVDLKARVNRKRLLNTLEMNRGNMTTYGIRKERFPMVQHP